MRRRSVSLLAGGLTAGIGAGVLLIVAGVFGFRPAIGIRNSLLLVVAVGLLATLYRGDLDRSTFRMGGAAAAVAAVAGELAGGSPGFGAAQWSLVAVGLGVAVSGPLSGRRRWLRQLPWWWWCFAGLALVLFALVRVAAEGGTFGHDESAYALKGRALLSGTPDTGWVIHRGWVQSLLALAVLPFTSSEFVMRVVSAVLAVATVAAVWWLGKTVSSNRVGLGAAAVFATGPEVVRRGAEFLTDLPSTGLLLVITTLWWRWLHQEAPGDRRLYLSVALAALAFYWRYQVILSLALLALTAGWLFWARIRERRRAVIGAVGLGVVLLVPHFVQAVAETGNPIGILTFTGQVAGREYLGEGLVDYALAFPDQLAGQVGALLVVVAIGWLVALTVAALRARRLSAPSRAAYFLALPALGQLLILGVVSHGEPRFVFYPVALLLLVGAMALDDLLPRLGRHGVRAGVAALAVAVLAMFGLNAERADRNAEARAESNRVVVQAAKLVAREGGADCGAVTGRQPAVTWISGCPTALFDGAGAVIPDYLGPAPHLILFETGPRQPTGDLLEEYLALTDGAPVVFESEGSFGDAAVYRVTR